MTDNVPSTTDNVPETTKRHPGRPKGVPSTKRYWGEEYCTVNLHLDRRVHKLFKIMAIRADTPLLHLVNEALVAWVMWIAKAERNEGEDKDRANKEFNEAADLLYELRREKQKSSLAVRLAVAKRERMEKAVTSRRIWQKTYPGTRWPGVGKQPEWLKKENWAKQPDNVPETT